MGNVLLPVLEQAKLLHQRDSSIQWLKRIKKLISLIHNSQNECPVQCEKFGGRRLRSSQSFRDPSGWWLCHLQWVASRPLCWSPFQGEGKSTEEWMWGSSWDNLKVAHTTSAHIPLERMYSAHMSTPSKGGWEIVSLDSHMPNYNSNAMKKWRNGIGG